MGDGRGWERDQGKSASLTISTSSFLLEMPSANPIIGCGNSDVRGEQAGEDIYCADILFEPVP